MIGLILIIVGAVFLLQNLGYISGGDWSIIWPAILIIIGLWILLKKEHGGFYWGEWCGWKKWKKKEEEKPSRVLRKRSKSKNKSKIS